MAVGDLSPVDPQASPTLMLVAMRAVTVDQRNLVVRPILAPWLFDWEYGL